MVYEYQLTQLCLRLFWMKLNKNILLIMRNHFFFHNHRYLGLEGLLNIYNAINKMILTILLYRLMIVAKLDKSSNFLVIFDLTYCIGLCCPYITHS